MKSTSLVVRTVLASLSGIVVLLGVGGVPAHAAYPVTQFPRFSAVDANSQPIIGENQVAVTWYNRSVGVSGWVTDYVDGGNLARVCVSAYTGYNAGGGWSGRHCRSAHDRTRTFEYTIDTTSDGGDLTAPYFSAKVELCQEAPNGDFRCSTVNTRTRNRP